MEVAGELHILVLYPQGKSSPVTGGQGIDRPGNWASTVV